ncbi:MAG: serine/threonine protein kinase [Deltaproteobacteria bacterium]|nr:serine/threonine protein kinase [Deltaproteobacteria bacterium]
MTAYRDAKSIGSGGFGEVCLCERESDGEQFAKKRLISSSPDAIERFAREVRLLNSLDHPNVVKVIAKRLNGPPYFYVMPLYAGALDGIISQLRGDTNRIETIFSRVLAGTAYAHEQGVIHRDLKPQNVLLNSDTDIVVSDFGLGRQLDSVSTRHTKTGIGMGTQLYMAPEQLKDLKSVDRRCDVFALGRMLIELYTGMLSPGEQDLSAVPPRILPLVHRSTHHDADRRFESAVEFRTAWQQALVYLSRATGVHSLQQLTAELIATPDLPDEKVRDLVNTLVDCVSDPDEIQSAIMKLPPLVIGRAFAVDQNSMETVIDVFGKFIVEQGYSFEYTDTIATHCTKIFHEISSPLSRARIIASVAEIGVGHNRWFVIGRAANLIESVEREADIQATIDVLAVLDSLTRDGVAAYIDFPKVALRLRQLLETSKGGA